MTLSCSADNARRAWRRCPKTLAGESEYTYKAVLVLPTITVMIEVALARPLLCLLE